MEDFGDDTDSQKVTFVYKWIVMKIEADAKRYMTMTVSRIEA